MLRHVFFTLPVASDTFDGLETTLRAWSEDEQRFRVVALVPEGQAPDSDIDSTARELSSRLVGDPLYQLRSLFTNLGPTLVRWSQGFSRLVIVTNSEIFALACQLDLRETDASPEPPLDFILRTSTFERVKH